MPPSAEGQELPIAQYTALFSLLGTTYGGDGETTFQLPDLRGRASMHWGQGAGLSNRAIGQTVGQSEHTLTEAEMAGHTHTTSSLMTGSTGGGQAHNNMAPSLGLTQAIALQGIYPSESRGGLDPFIGEISTYAFNFAPPGWSPADGQIISIAQYDALFSLLGTTYGGDGETSFGLPDLRGRVAMHQGTGPGLSSRVVGQRTGAEEVQLSIAELPGHEHSLLPSVNTGSTGDDWIAAPLRL